MMPLAIILIALILIVAGFKGTAGSLFGLIEQTFSQVLVPFVAILIVGALGYVPGMKRLSDAFLALILLAMFLTNSKNGLISKFQSAIRNPQAPPSPQASGTVTVGAMQWPTTANENNPLDIAPLSGLDTLQPIQSLVG